MESDQKPQSKMPAPQVTLDSDAPSGPALELKPSKEMPAWKRGMFAGVYLYFFLCSIKVMGGGLKSLGEASPLLEDMLSWGDQNPFLAMFAGVLITAIVQSSSFTTSLIITLVAAGTLKLDTAVYMVMGANIGTSITGIIIAMGHIRLKRQFRRAFTAALVHGIVNLLTVVVLFPLEWISSVFAEDGRGVMTRFAVWSAQAMGLDDLGDQFDPIKVITKPVVKSIEWFFELITTNPVIQGSGIAIVGFILLLTSLVLMVINLKGALLSRIEGLFRRIFFRNDAMAYTVGTVTTILVQSSSVSTGIIIPLAGAGVVKLKRVFPFMLGANLGTTVTGIIAATAVPVQAAVAVAITHVVFNVFGTVIWYPLGRVPIGLARWYGKLAAKSKKYAFLFLFVIFVLIPLVGIGLTQLMLQRG